MVKDEQVKLLMKNIKEGKTQEVAAAKAGMTPKTARKYRKSGKLPSESKKTYTWKNKKDIFAEHWHEIEAMLIANSNLQAKTALAYLIEKYPELYSSSLGRSMRRKFQSWRAINGKEKEVMFKQQHHPGQQSQSDYTHMDKLGISIAGKHFKHLLFHFRLSYSKWEDVMICLSETFDSLATGVEQAFWKLGGVTKEHRTDNLGAAKKHSAGFTENWTNLTNHYQVSPTTNNPGKSNENGIVEKSNHLLKVGIEQALIIRGSKNFASLEEYQSFLDAFISKANSERNAKVQEEVVTLSQLPVDKWYSPKVLPVRVSSGSTVQISKVLYSVPSRLIGNILTAHIYPAYIELFYDRKLIQKMDKQQEGALIDYRHIISSLVHKPGAFANYQYRESLFPNLSFRKAYDILAHSKSYLELLLLAKMHGELVVSKAIAELLSKGSSPQPEIVRELIKQDLQPLPVLAAITPNLLSYNDLLGASHVGS